MSIVVEKLGLCIQKTCERGVEVVEVGKVIARMVVMWMGVESAVQALKWQNGWTGRESLWLQHTGVWGYPVPMPFFIPECHKGLFSELWHFIGWHVKHGTGLLRVPCPFGVRNKIGGPTGQDVVIGMHQGSKAWLLPKCKVVIESMAWNPAPPPKSSCASAYPWASMHKILLGGCNGTIYEMLLDAHDDIFKMPDRYVSPIFISMPQQRYHLPRSKNIFSFK